MINTKFLIRFRAILIELLNALDDELIQQGAISCRAVPPKAERRKMASVDVNSRW